MLDVGFSVAVFGSRAQALRFPVNTPGVSRVLGFTHKRLGIPL